MVTRLSATALIGRDFSKILAIGQEVVQVEGRALIELANHLDESFAQAVELLMAGKAAIAVAGGACGLQP